MVKNIPADLQRRFCVSHEEAVLFTQISADFNSYRDAVRFHSGCEVRLQELCEGIQVQVLSLENLPAGSGSLIQAQPSRRAVSY